MAAAPISPVLTIKEPSPGRRIASERDSPHHWQLGHHLNAQGKIFQIVLRHDPCWYAVNLYSD